MFLLSKFSYVKELFCSKCDRIFAIGEIHHLCTDCHAPLLVKYDLDELKKVFRPESLQNRPNTLWRYHELLPVQEEENVVSLGEGMTPLVSMPRLGRDMGIDALFMKDEGLIPTGTFKARGAAVGISMAKELGVKDLAMPTNGNAGAAWALYAARAQISANIVMPIDAPSITRNECAASGANLALVDGLISDAGKIVAQAVEENGLYDVSTLKEPYRIEGKKTMGLEIAEQMNWEMPDVILYPTGGGVGIIGIFKALKELQALGWMKEGPLPRLVAVQAVGCAPIVKAWEERKTSSEFWDNSETVAFGINVPKALGDFLVLEALYETNGCGFSVDDADMLKEQAKISSYEGCFICPEGAAAFVAARRLRENGWIKDGERVVILNTGMGIKYPNTLQFNPPILAKDDKMKMSGRLIN